MWTLALLPLLAALCHASPRRSPRLLSATPPNQATPSTSALLRTSPDLSSHVEPPLPSLAATTQYRGATAISTDTGPTLEEYENFFKTVDNLLWDSTGEGRQFRRGWLARPRPQFLMRRNGQTNNFYRAVVDQCYDFLCQLGINGMVNRIGRIFS